MEPSPPGHSGTRPAQASLHPSEFKPSQSKNCIYLSPDLRYQRAAAQSPSDAICRHPVQEVPGEDPLNSPLPGRSSAHRARSRPTLALTREVPPTGRSSRPQPPQGEAPPFERVYSTHGMESHPLRRSAYRAMPRPPSGVSPTGPGL